MGYLAAPLPTFWLGGAHDMPPSPPAHFYTKVAEGCEFSDGRVAVCWMMPNEPQTEVWHRNIASVFRIHTELGHWIVEFID
jgi:hypothetical protein